MLLSDTIMIRWKNSANHSCILDKVAIWTTSWRWLIARIFVLKVVLVQFTFTVSDSFINYRYFSVVCTAGEPLKDSSGIKNIPCPSSICPNTHECTSGVCCPKKRKFFTWIISFISLSTNELAANLFHFHWTFERRYLEFFDSFNVKPRIIIASLFAIGFLSNSIILWTHLIDNSLVDTETVCSLPKSVGICGSFVDKWWFNAKTGNCERFVYSGCQGNANNFNSYTDCQNFCRDTTSNRLLVLGSFIHFSIF